MSASIASLKTVGNWSEQTRISMRDALAVSMDVLRNSGGEAVGKCINAMRISAAVLTDKGKKNRPVVDNPSFRHFLRKDQYKKVAMQGNRMGDYFRFTADKLMQPESGKSLIALYANDKKRIAPIKRAGMAKESWGWGGSAKVGGKMGKQKRLKNVTSFLTVLGKTSCGYIFTNKLSYILKALPGGWESTVMEKVGNRIMGQARDKLEREWLRRVGYSGKIGRVALKENLAQFMEVINDA